MGCSIVSGRGALPNTALFQADDGGGAQATASDSAWHGIGGEAVDSSHAAVYVDGTGTTSSATVTNVTVNLDMGGILSFTGSVAEGAIVLGTAVSSGNMSTIQAAQKSYWGY